MTTFTEEQKEVKKKITRKRVEITEIKSTVDNLGEETLAVLPEDMAIMYAGKLCAMLIKNNVASQNILAGYLRQYPDIDENTKKQLEALQKDFSDDFELAKKRTNKTASTHPLYDKLSGIKGISGYQIALLMSYVKDISRFDTPSSLCVYAGMASVNGMPVTKANINKINEYRTSTFGKEFKGFNTELSGRMFVIVDCLIRSKGFFYNYYAGIRQRLEKRALNGNETFVATIEQQKESKGIMKAGHHYMKGKKNQSLIMWSDKNAKRRVARTFLHIFWKEWREIAGLPIRHPYAVSYLGHNTMIGLDEILLADSVKRVNKKKDKNTEVNGEDTSNDDSNYDDSKSKS